MKRRCLLAVSPHLDDAVFSAGGTLARCARNGWRVVVVTCFTGNVDRPTGFALACQLDKGLAADVDYMALRRAEDRAACAAIGAIPLHLPFLEAPHRGYGDAAALFAGRRAQDHALEATLSDVLRRIIVRESPHLLLGPIGLGGHVDHLVVRAALASAAAPVSRVDLAVPAALGPPAAPLSSNASAAPFPAARRCQHPRLWLWQDWPYADRVRSGFAASDRVIDVDLRSAELEALTAGCCAYSSQLGFQFGSAERMLGRLGMRRSERFLRADPPTPG